MWVQTLLWTLSLLLPLNDWASAHGTMGRRHGTVAAIFGMGGNDAKIDQPPSALPPPPPRPPNTQPVQQRQSQMPPPPPRKDQLAGKSNKTENAPDFSSPPRLDLRNDPRQPQSSQTPPPPPQGWGMPHPRQQEQQPGFWDPYSQGAFPPPEALLYDLDQALQREANLVQQVHNLSSTVGLLEQRDDLHIRQMDVLTERIMDVEAIKASRETRLLEVEANCTALQKELAVLRGDLEEYEARCSKYQQQVENLESEKHDMSKRLKLAQRDAENLATLIETHRMNEERGSKGAKKGKRRGFFAWLFRFGVEEEEDLDELRDTARSTLLQALQNERSNVEELENTVAVLQTNNSAIAEQVESRNAIIDELNNRIAVFEEDKVVLKAALKQLQKEIKEEAPKTARLKSELQGKQKEIAKLKNAIEALRVKHANETAQMNRVIQSKDRVLNQTKTNLTMIGTYVDKLEERLADFAVARRDVDVRARKMDELEQEVKSLSEEKVALMDRLSAYEEEHVQLKQLIEDLITERKKLLRQNEQLDSQCNTTRAELQGLVTSFQSTTHELARTQNVTKYWKKTARELESQLKHKSQEYEQLLQKQSSVDDFSSDMRQQIAQLEQEENKWKNRLSLAEAARDELELKLREVVTAQIKAEEQAAMLQRNLTEVEEKHSQESSRLREALEVREKMESALEESRKREESLRMKLEKELETIKQTANEREPTLQQELLSQAKLRVPVSDTPSVLSESVRNATSISANGTTPVVKPVLNKTTTSPIRRKISTVPTMATSKQALRPVRKFFAHATGLHGFFSKKKPARPNQGVTMRRTSSATVSDSSLSKNATSPYGKPSGATAVDRVASSRLQLVPPRASAGDPSQPGMYPSKSQQSHPRRPPYGGRSPQVRPQSQDPPTNPPKRTFGGRSSDGSS